MKLALLDDFFTDIYEIIERYATPMYNIDLKEADVLDIAATLKETFHQSIEQIGLEKRLLDMYEDKKPTYEELSSLNKKLILTLRENSRLFGKPSPLIDAIRNL